MLKRWFAFLLLAVLMPFSSGCIRRYAMNKLGDALAGSSTTFASDDDPELIGAALPFSLKLMESILAETPRHRGLLSATASGFAQYSYVYVQQAADEAEDSSLERSTALKLRARRLFLRARDYGLRGLEASHPGFGQALGANPRSAVLVATKRDVSLLYWTAAAWGSAIAISKDVPELIAGLGTVEALIDRSLALDESFDSGSIHGFLISYEMSRPGGTGDPAERSRRHFERAVALTAGQSAAPYLSFAEAVLVGQQKRAEFKTLLERALAIDVNARPEWRLANLVMQRRARWLLGRVDEMFVE